MKMFTEVSWIYSVGSGWFLNPSIYPSIYLSEPRVPNTKSQARNIEYTHRNILKQCNLNANPTNLSKIQEAEHQEVFGFDVGCRMCNVT